MEILMVVGAPGAGKSSAVGTLVEGLIWRRIEWVVPGTVEPPIRVLPTLAYWTGLPTGLVWELGGEDDGFGFRGSDRLQSRAAAAVDWWLNDFRPPRVLVEGDRLATATFARKAEEAGYTVRVAELVGAFDVLETRRRARHDRKAEAFASRTRQGALSQRTGYITPSRSKGVATKARNLAAYAAASAVFLGEEPRARSLTVDSGDQTPGHVAELLARFSPVARALRDGNRPAGALLPDLIEEQAASALEAAAVFSRRGGKP